MTNIVDRVFVGPSGSQVTLSIERPTEDKEMWKCVYHVVKDGEVKTSFAAGFDSMQALLMAISKARAYLQFSESCRGLNLGWLEEDKLELDVE